MSLCAAAVTDQLYAGAKAFEFGADTAGVVSTANKATLLAADGTGAPAGSVLGGTTLARKLETPAKTVQDDALKAINDTAGVDAGELMLSPDGVRYINQTEAANGINYPVPLPAAAVAGDIVTLTLTLTLTNADGTTTAVPYTLTGADILAGVAQVPVTKAQLGADGAKTAAAQVASADGTLNSGSFALQPFTVDLPPRRWMQPLPAAWEGLDRA